MSDTAVVPHALCIIADPELRRTVCRTLQAAGVGVMALNDLGIGQPHPGMLVFVDEEALRTVQPEEIRQTIGTDSRIIMLNGSLDDDDVICLMRDHVDHLVDVRGDLDERGLLVTSTKLLTGDIFGLEKYLGWGARVCEVDIDGYDDKRQAVDAVIEYARSVGACRRVVHKVECVADELLMNALYDAEVLGATPHAVGCTRDAHGVPASKALLRYASDGRYLAVSVEDRWGALRKEMVIDALLRARAERGAPRQSRAGGAGLGFYMILACASQLIANIDPGRRTEMVCLFDLRQSNRDASTMSRAFHIFYQEQDDCPALAEGSAPVPSC